MINEKNFIKQLKCGNEKAINYVIDEYSWVLKTVIARNMSTLPEFKEECMNDCLLAIWNNINTYDEKRASFKSWIAGIAKHKCISYKRKYLKELNNVNIDDLDLIAEKNVEQGIIDEEMRNEVYELLSCLSDEDKIIFSKFYFEDADVAGISKQLNISKDMIYNRLSRGRKKIKKNFLKLGGYENER